MRWVLQCFLIYSCVKQSHSEVVLFHLTELLHYVNFSSYHEEETLQFFGVIVYDLDSLDGHISSSLDVGCLENLAESSLGDEAGDLVGLESVKV